MDRMNALREAFYSPADEFSPIPFWFWNDELTEEELLRLFDDLFVGWKRGSGLYACLSNIAGGVFVSEDFSFVDRTYKAPDSEKIFASRTLARLLCDLSDANVRRVLEFEYRHAFLQSKSAFEPSALTLAKIAEKYGKTDVYEAAVANN